MRAPHCADHEWKSSPSNVLAFLLVVVEIYTTHTSTPTHTCTHIHTLSSNNSTHRLNIMDCSCCCFATPHAYLS